MDTAVVRRAHNATNVLHSFIYFAPEAEEHFTGAGLEPGRMCYFAGRAAAMGAVGPGVVTATFYNFSPGLVGNHIPRAWDLASPADVIAARFEAVDLAMTRLLGADVITSADLARLADLTREAASVCTADGRPLYAGHAELSWPAAPHLVLWHALTLLREHRGDGHIAALGTAGLSGIEALITHSATGQGFIRDFAKSSRGWQDPEWAAALQSLVARGLMTEDGELTEAGEALRGEIEEETDQLAVAPWQHLGDEKTEEVITAGRALTRAALKAGALPANVFTPRPAR
jgi:hypothetical protein